MNNPCFLLDANCFIEPRNTFYPFCYVPAYWNALLRGHEAGMVYTLSEVKTEIAEREDEIKNWVEQDGFPSSFVLTATQSTVLKFAEIQRWTAAQPHFSTAAKTSFASNTTDGYLVAHAKEHNMILVTQEKFVTDPKTTKIKIPNLCRQFDVPCVNLFEMLKQLNVRFVLE